MPVREESARFFPRSFKKVARQVGRSDGEHRDTETHPAAIAEATDRSGRSAASAISNE